jgi:hypothetical protein
MKSLLGGIERRPVVAQWPGSEVIVTVGTNLDWSSGTSVMGSKGSAE